MLKSDSYDHGVIDYLVYGTTDSGIEEKLSNIDEDLSKQKYIDLQLYHMF
jgi:hypothetical protein